MAQKISAVGFDADDTLWENQHFYDLSEQRFAELLAEYSDLSNLSQRLVEAERRNLKLYGFGIKGFTLSLIETAVEVTDGKVPGEVVGRILEIGREMLSHPVNLLPHARTAIENLAGRYQLLLITKGDLFDQERKIAASGLAELFDAIEIVSDKTATSYDRIFARYGDGAERSLMVGNSLKSDVAPVLEAGGYGVFVPHKLAWSFEHAEEPSDHPRYRRISTLDELGPLIEALP